MKSFVKILITIVITLAVVGIFLFATRKSKQEAAPPTKVQTEAVTPGKIVEYVSAPGEVRPKKKVSISAKISARISSLPFEEGQNVQQNDILVKLDSKDLESQLRSAEAGKAAQKAQIEVEKARIASQTANLQGLKASLDQAKRDFERQKALLQTRDVSQAEYDRAKALFDEAQARYVSAEHSLQAAKLNLIVLEHNLEVAQARIEEAREALSYTTIRSPMDGVITRLNAEEGELVVTGTMNNAGTVIMEVADLSTMQVAAEVDEADVGKIQIGQNVNIHIHAFDQNDFNGQVESIALKYTLGANGKYFDTRIALQQSDIRLFSGLTADVEILTKTHENVLKVPSQAVLARRVDSLPTKIREENPHLDKDKTFAPVVYIYEDKKAKVRPVQMGPSDITHTVIEGGINQGQYVITGPYKILESLQHDQPVIDEKQSPNEKEAQTQVNPKANKRRRRRGI